MKTKFYFLVSFLFVAISSIYANETDSEKVKVKDFNFSNEINYEGSIESFMNEEVGVMVYILPMKDSDDLLIAYLGKGENELTPVSFMNLSENKLIYKDVNNRKEVIIATKESGSINVEYLEVNDSKIGFALKKCPGGSTLNCIKTSMMAIASDGEAAFYCALAGAYCPAAVATACAISCNS